MKTTSYQEFTLEREYPRNSRPFVPGMIEIHQYQPFSNETGYELGRRQGTLCGLVIGSVSGAIMTLAVLLLL